MKKNKKPVSSGKGLYKDSTNGAGCSQFWNLINASKGKVPQNYQDKTLPMNNEK